MKRTSGYQGRKQSIQKKKIKARVRAMLLRGVTCQTEIAEYIGRSVATVGTYIKEIDKEWIPKDLKTVEAIKNRRIAQLLGSARKAMDSFERSRQDAEEITRVVTPKKCRDCKGSGMIAEEVWCPTCKGDGTVMAEVVTRKVKGRAGDSSFLKEFRMSIQEVCKLEGLYPATEVKGKVQIDSRMEQVITSRIDFDNVPNDILLEMREMNERLKLYQRPPKMLTVESEPVNGENGDGNGEEITDNRVGENGETEQENE